MRRSKRRGRHDDHRRRRNPDQYGDPDVALFFVYFFPPDETSAVFLPPFHSPSPSRHGEGRVRHTARERKKNKGFLYYLLYPTPSTTVSGYDLVTRATREHTAQRALPRFRRPIDHVFYARHDRVAGEGKTKIIQRET